MEEHTCGNCTLPHKACMDLVQPMEHYYGVVAGNESLPSDEEDQDHHMQNGGHLSTTPDKRNQTQESQEDDLDNLMMCTESPDGICRLLEVVADF